MHMRSWALAFFTARARRGTSPPRGYSILADLEAHARGGASGVRWTPLRRTFGRWLYLVARARGVRVGGVALDPAVADGLNAAGGLGRVMSCTVVFCNV